MVSKRIILFLGVLTLNLANILLLAQEYRYRTILSKDIHPGVIYSLIQTSAPQRIHLISASLKNCALEIGTFRAESLQTVSTQFDSLKRCGFNPLAAINADFFEYVPGVPVGNQISRGNIINTAKTNRTHFGVSKNGRVFIERTSFIGVILNAQNDSLIVDGYNSRDTSQRILLWDLLNEQTLPERVVFMLRIDSVTASRETLWACLESVKRELRQDDYKYLVVSRVDSAQVHDFLISSRALRIAMNFMNLPEIPSEMVGGLGRIVKNGLFISDSVNCIKETGGIEFFKVRHPRTFAAINRDTTMLFLGVVDGRSPQSVGMNFKEMADFIAFIGGTEAVNFDGGGSSTMVIHGNVVNKPSDKTGERPCANSLVLFSVKR